MNHLKKLSNQLAIRVFLLVFLSNALLLVIFMLLKPRVNLSDIGLLVALTPIALVLALLSTLTIVALSIQPLKAIWQAIWHISPSEEDVPAPDLEALQTGKEFAKALINEVYNLASTNGTMPRQEGKMVNPLDQGARSFLEYLPMPVLALDSEMKIAYANGLASRFAERTHEDLTGKYIYDALQLSFSGGSTLEEWLKESQSKRADATFSWDRVRLQLPDDKGSRQFDLIARYSKDNPTGFETLLALFDHSEKYSTEDTGTSYVALAVHELRTPLTVLRGYIEVFEDELDTQLTPELRDFMHKMSASAQTLAAFVSNILNVARVDENQLTLSLHEAKWGDLLQEICRDLELRVKVRGKRLELDIAPDLPSVAVDKISMYEVMSNLIDNAVKYSGDSDKVVVHAHSSKDGTIETVVQDFGIGIPPSAVKHLFTKFYRSHRSKGTISGSGLGLYLVKAIVSAHGGTVWVQSKDGEGSSFGFTLQPYERVASQLKDTGSNTIERQAHGWIKNHSMYRR